MVYLEAKENWKILKFHYLFNFSIILYENVPVCSDFAWKKTIIITIDKKNKEERVKQRETGKECMDMHMHKTNGIVFKYFWFFLSLPEC